jgi:hypothetical protein
MLMYFLFFHRKNLESKKYRTVSQYKEEMLRMFSNCEKFNGAGDSEILTENSRLRDIFKQYV